MGWEAPLRDVRRLASRCVRFPADPARPRVPALRGSRRPLLPVPTMSELDEVFAAIRAAHGPGRVEFLFDRGRSYAADMRDGIGQLVLNPEIGARDELTGTVVSHDDGKRYRVIVSEAMRGARDKNGRVRAGYFVAAAPLWDPIYLNPPPFRR